MGILMHIRQTTYDYMTVAALWTQCELYLWFGYITLTCPKREEAATLNKGTPILIKMIPIIRFSKSLTLNKGKDTAMHNFFLPRTNIQIKCIICSTMTYETSQHIRLYNKPNFHKKIQNSKNRSTSKIYRKHKNFLKIPDEPPFVTACDMTMTTVAE